MADNRIQELIRSGTNVVFVFGNIGTGKTCFFLTIVNYLYKTCLLRLNSKDNIEGIAFIEKLSKQLKEKKELPAPTSGGQIEEVDLRFKFKNKEVVYTFLDMAGEDLRYVDPTIISSEINISSEKRGNLDEKINKYLKNQKLPVILLCFIDYELPEEQDRLCLLYTSPSPRDPE